MAIQDDNTILNKGDLKAYHEAIAPMLGGTFMVSTNNSDYYSTDEKVVGVWTDGKPLYQKTFILLNNEFPATTIGSGTTVLTTIIDDSTLELKNNISFIQNTKATDTDNILQLPHIAVDAPTGTVYGVVLIKQRKMSDSTKPIVLYMRSVYSNGFTFDAYITLQYTKTTDAAGSATTTPGAYDINFPNTWPENTEIYFGNGLYGQRFTGTITAAANEDVQTAINTPQPVNVINFSGWWLDRSPTESGATRFSLNGQRVDSTYFTVSCLTSSADYRPSLGTKSWKARTNAPYSIWMTYTK